VDTRSLDTQTISTFRVVGEQHLHATRTHVGGVRGQGPPGGAFDE